jgi:hypothetical protein
MDQSIVWREGAVWSVRCVLAFDASRSGLDFETP